MQKWFYIYRKFGFCFIFLLPLVLSYSQASDVDAENSRSKIFNISQEKYGLDQQLANGVYFEDIYRTAIGHPYFGEDKFSGGSLVYLNKMYKGVEIKYNIFEQQILIRHLNHDFPLITIANDVFLSSFTIYGMDFRKIQFGGTEPAFYQIIADKGPVQCYYYWYKSRRESIKEERTMIYNFSSDKRRPYLLMNDVLNKYKGNISFLKLFPDELKSQVKNYMRMNKIKVRKASDKEMKGLILYSQDLLNQRKG